MSTSGSTRATVMALIANAGIAVAKFVTFAFTASASMLAEAIHSVADTSNQLLLLLGMRRAKREATDLHQFGFGRERYFWAFVVAIVLFTLGSLASLNEGISKVRHPHEVSSLGWAVGVLLVGIVLEGISFRVAVREANRERTTGWWTYIRKNRSPELPVVVMEDAGAMLGLTIALAGVVAAALTGDPRFDALGSVVIGLLLGVIAVVLAIEMRSLLLGESATLGDQQIIRDAIVTDDRVIELLELRTQHLGPDQLLVGAKIQLLPTLDVAGVVSTIDSIEERIRAQLPKATALYLEPAE